MRSNAAPQGPSQPLARIFYRWRGQSLIRADWRRKVTMGDATVLAWLRRRSMFWYRIAAEAVVLVHAGYIGFVVFGMVAIAVGLAMGQPWVRHFWFRTIHLAMIGIVALEGMARPRLPAHDSGEDPPSAGGGTGGL